MKHIAHTINREGVLVPANGFKQPEPTKTLKSQSIWMHSVERTDRQNPFKAFAIFGLMIIGMVLILIFIR